MKNRETPQVQAFQDITPGNETLETTSATKTFNAISIQLLNSRKK